MNGLLFTVLLAIRSFPNVVKENRNKQERVVFKTIELTFSRVFFYLC